MTPSRMVVTRQKKLEQPVEKLHITKTSKIDIAPAPSLENDKVEAVEEKK